MKEYRSLLIQNAVLLVCSAALFCLSFFSSVIEKLYAEAFYPVFAQTLRFLFGWLPFSLGDLLYSTLIIGLVSGFLKYMQYIKPQYLLNQISYNLLKLIQFLLITYIVFQIFWGLNYSRKGIGAQMSLMPASYSTTELQQLTQWVIMQLNENSKQVGEKPPDYSFIRQQASEIYAQASHQYSFLTYKYASIKPSLFAYIGNYMGFTGYYNPFTGEAQVNTTVPHFLLPFITCHEMAHQLGYASEDEASFVAFLAIHSGNKAYFKYSLYFDLYLYTNSELYSRDSAVAIQFSKQLLPKVHKDLLTYKTFWQQYRSKTAEGIFRLLYGNYLKANKQPKGIETYDEIVAWLIAFEKKNNPSFFKTLKNN